MEIKTYWSWETPADITEPIVVIDVWSATTNLSLILSKKPKRLLLVNEKNYQKALSFYPNSLLIGESYQLPKSKFLLTNYPAEIYQAELKNQSLLFMTINGTRVFEKFKNKKLVIGGAFNNLQTVVKFLKNYQQVSLVMAGDKPYKVIEDEICAQIYKFELQGKTYSWENLKEKMIKESCRYYSWPPALEKKSLPLIFEKSSYNIIPKAFIDKAGFLAIKNLLP